MADKLTYEELEQRVKELEKGAVERERAEVALHENQRLLNSILESTVDGILVGDRDGTFSYVNSRFAEMWHIPKEVMETKERHKLRAVVSEQLKDSSAFFSKLQEMYQSEEELLDLVEFKDGRIFERFSTPLIKDSNVSGRVWSFRNITEHKQAEKALRESEKKYRQLFNTVSNAIMLFDAETKEFVDVNDASQNLYGYSKEEFLKLRHFDITAEPEESEDSIKQTISGEITEITEIPLRYHKRKDGTKFPVEISIGTFVLGNRQVLCGVIKDITERKRTEEALRESEEKYRSLFENTGTATFVAEEDMTVSQVNAKCEELSGYSRDEIVGKMKTTDFIPIEELNRIKKYHFERRIKDDDIPLEYELKLVDKDGNIKNVFIQVGMIPGTKKSIASVIDITPQKQAEKALRESEKQYRELANSLPQVVFEMDAKGLITYANRNAFEFYGYTQDDFEKGVTALQMLIPEDRDRAFDNIQRGLKGEELGSREYTALRKGGTTFPVAVHVNPIIYENKPEGLRGIMIDITDRKRAEEEKKKLEAQLHQVQRMKALGTLAGGIAHDFNNLLTVIQGHTSLMLMDIDLYHPHFDHLKGIEDNVKSAADLTKQLLGFARGGKYEVKTTNLNELIKNQNRMFGRAKKEVTIRGKYEKNPWPVEVDQGQIEQVLLNIYVNAWQAMPGGGNLYIQSENIIIDENYGKPYHVEPGRYVKISITDTGVGMDEATRQRIFDPFFTTKEMEKGTGLGLSSAYGIIKNHDGFINVYSEKGEGTTFSIYFPASEKEVIDEKELAGDILKGSETVLLVDDEDMIIDVGQDILESLGYKVLPAISGKEAIEVYQENREKIDMVIMDMIMPEMGGGDTYDKLKEINPDIKVLLSSGYSINGQATEILERGCNGYIQKPFNMTDLSKKIREILDKD